MFERTRGRGPRDTGRGDVTEGAAGPSVMAAARRLEPARHVFVVCCVLAILIHLPALPLRIMGWVDLILDTRSAVEDEPFDADSFIPIELDLDGLEPSGQPGEDPSAPGSGQGTGPTGETEVDVGVPPAVSASAPPAPPPPPVPPPPPPTPTGDDALDAGLPDAAPRAEDAGPEDAGPPDAEPADAGPEDAAPSDADPPDASPVSEPSDAGPRPIASLDPPKAASPPGLQDPDELTKVTRGLTAAPNVQVLLVGKQLRLHPVGKELGKLLSSLREWNSFFAGTGIDPVADLEHMQITGPELRNSSQVVSILEFSSSPEAIRSALDVVVKRGGGTWLEGKPFPTARAKADKAERLFVILPARRILAVLPGKDEAKIDDLAKLPAYPANLPFAIQISMVTPHRAFRSMEVIEIPESIVKMRLRAYGHGAGGGKLELEFLDESADKAIASAAKLTEQWGKVQAAAMLGLIFLDDMPFKAEGTRIVGSTTFTREQLERILALAGKSFVSKSRGGNKASPLDKAPPSPGRKK